MAPVSSTPWYRRGKRDINGIGCRARQFDRGEVTGVGRIRQAGHFGLPPNRCEGNDAVIQRRTTTQDQISAIRIGVGQLPIRVRVKMQALVTYQPPPRLRVMNGRSSRRQSQHRPDCARIGKARVHGSGSFRTTSSCQRLANHTGRARARCPQSGRTLCHGRCGYTLAIGPATGREAWTSARVRWACRSRRPYPLLRRSGRVPPTRPRSRWRRSSARRRTSTLTLRLRRGGVSRCRW